MVTSWFWLVARRADVALLPPMVKPLLGGNEETIAAYLALLLGRGRNRLRACRLLAAAFIPFRILLGALCLGIFSLMIGFTLWGAPGPAVKSFWGRRKFS